MLEHLGAEHDAERVILQRQRVRRCDHVRRKRPKMLRRCPVGGHIANVREQLPIGRVTRTDIKHRGSGGRLCRQLGDEIEDRPSLVRHRLREPSQALRDAALPGRSHLRLAHGGGL